MRYKHLSFMFIPVAVVVLLLHNGISAAQDGLPLSDVVLTATAQIPTPSPTPELSREVQSARRYITQKYGIPEEQLTIVNEHERAYPLIGRTFRYVGILYTSQDKLQEYRVLVDLTDGRIEEDFKTVEAAEEKAYRTKYGKLHYTLHERLHSISDSESLPVAIWVASRAEDRTREEVYAELTTRYPEAAHALVQEALPWAVDEPTLAKEIQEAYRQMRTKDTTARLQPLVDSLNERGFTVNTYGAMPSITTFLPKRAILSLAKQEDVGLIYLIEERGSEEMNIAGPSIRAPAVWDRGFDGSNVNIAFLDDGNIHDNVSCLDIIARRVSGDGFEVHNTKVASIATCNHDIYKGIAHGAQIIDAGFDYDSSSQVSQVNAVEALIWAIQDAGPAEPAKIVNSSYGWENDDYLNWTDRVFDFWAREEQVFIAKSAGNTSGSITSPGKGWNVLTVGGTNDQETTLWSDDTMYDLSSYTNPYNSDREKPEVVAPAVDITAIIDNDVPFADEGTSFAAPQVAGLAALLIDRHWFLRFKPEAIRAIIMASAVHNVDGPSGIPTGEDLKDGAGAIDAALADNIAKTRSYSSTSPCLHPCWWSTNTNFPVGDYKYRYIKVSRGERVRVAISWWSYVDCPNTNNCDYSDNLGTNLALLMFDPDGHLVPGAYSNSNDNNYELVEFTAPQTGEYTIGVYNYSANPSDTSNNLGIAWVKDATYLPDLRNKDGWVSRLYVRNDGAQRRHVTINYFDTDGNPTPQVSDVCGLDPNQWCWIPVTDFDRIPSGTTGSAILDGGEDVSVIVVTDNDSAGKTYSYEGIPSTGERSQIGPGDELFIPSYRRARYGYDSWLTVQNMNTESADTTFTFYNDAGNQVESTSYNISAGGQRTVSLSGANEGSVRVTTNDKPVSVIVLHDHAGQAMGYSGLTRGATEGYFPSLFRDYYGLLSSYQIQEVTNQSVSGDAHYSNGISTSFSLSSRGHRQVGMRSEPLPNGWLGAAEFNRTGGSGQMTTATHHSYTRTGAAIGYTGFQNGAQDLLIPYLSNADNWRTGIAVQNVGTSFTVVQVKLYYGSGSSGPYVASFTLNPGQRYSVFNQIPLNFSGSAQLHSTSSEIAAVVHASTNNRAFGYRALVR